MQPSKVNRKEKIDYGNTSPWILLINKVLLAHTANWINIWLRYPNNISPRITTVDKNSKPDE